MLPTAPAIGTANSCGPILLKRSDELGGDLASIRKLSDADTSRDARELSQEIDSIDSTEGDKELAGEGLHRSKVSLTWHNQDTRRLG